jgi:hypothetical protein
MTPAFSSVAESVPTHAAIRDRRPSTAQISGVIMQVTFDNEEGISQPWISSLCESET